MRPASLPSRAVTAALAHSRLRQRLVAAVGAAAAALALFVYAVGGLSALERQTVDTRFQIRGVERPSGRVVIVGVDDQMLRTAGAIPPIRRVYYARLLDRLRAARARLVALDVQFLGASARPADDRALLQAIARSGRTLVVTQDDGRGTPPLPTGAASAPGAVLSSAGVDTDPDGTLRRMMYAQVALRTFAVRAAELVTGRHVIPFPGNHAWIDFRGPPGTFPTFSMADVLAGRVPASELAGKVVLVGVTAPVQRDVFVTAASSVPMAGVGVHANALETILDGVPLRPAGWLADALFVLALSALPSLLALRLSALYVLIAAVTAVAAYLVVVQLAFDSGRILTVLTPILGLALATAGVAGVDALVERRQRDALRAALDRIGVMRPGTNAFFVSYRREQSAPMAAAIQRELARRYGAGSVFMDTRTIRAGDEWPREIRKAILGCSLMLVLIGPEWLDTPDREGARRLDDPQDWVRREIEAGLGQPYTEVVPTLVGGARMSEASELPEPIRELAYRNAVVVTGADLRAELDAVLDSVDSARIRDGIGHEVYR